MPSCDTEEHDLENEVCCQFGKGQQKNEVDYQIVSVEFSMRSERKFVRLSHVLGMRDLLESCDDRFRRMVALSPSLSP